MRGTTSAQIVRLLRDAGATKIHMRITAPPFRFPCYYGTDVDSTSSLIATEHTPAQIAEMIGADTLGYFPTERLSELAGGQGYCSACFDGNYPTSVPSGELKNRFERRLSESE